MDNILPSNEDFHKPLREPRSRRILHVDMDAFFASVEVLDRPELRGRAVIVGGTPDGRGVVCTASYEAREFGVHSAMSAARAVKLCPHGVFLVPRSGRYSAVSKQIFQVFREYTPLVEPLSIDEAFLDVTGSRPLLGSNEDETEEDEKEVALRMAHEIQERVREATGGLTCSVGVASNKFLAKLASDLRKPAGITCVPENGIEEFLAPLPIRKLWGVGPKTAERLEGIGLKSIGDVQQVNIRDLTSVLGKESARHLSRLSRGVDDRTVRSEPRVAKSISQERTFGQFIPASDREGIERILFRLSDQVAYRLRQSGLWGRVVTLKVRDEDFKTLSRHSTLESATQVVEEIYATTQRLLREKVRLGGRKVRLLGVGVSHLTSRPVRQLEFFDKAKHEAEKDVASISDAVLDKLGDGAIFRASMMEFKRERR